MTDALLPAVLVFALAAMFIGVFGVRMTHVAGELARRTGMGEAIMGALFIGAATSLSGITASVTAAWSGYASLAVSNSLGGIAAQTAFLAIADFFYRRANLEHAAASVENLMMTAFLIILLSIHLVALSVPQLSLLGVHPATPVLIITYLFGMWLLNRTHEMPMWYPKRTSDTRREQTHSRRARGATLYGLWLRFVALAALVATAGWFLTHAAVTISRETGLAEGVVGGIFIAVSTSLPELVIAVTAVRMRALTLAVGDIIGGNAFDTLFIALSDIVYREGSIYAALTHYETFWLALTLLMCAVLIMGLIQRERHGIGNIGLESATLIVLYLGGVGLITLVL